MDPKYDVAISNIQKAIIQTGPVKDVRKQAEKYLRKKVDPPAWVTTAALIGVTAAKDGKVSTSKIKNLRLKGGEENKWNLRPDVDYHFSGATSGSLNFNLSF